MDYRPTLLDLYCGGGGAAAGYARAGFRVVGVDHRPQAHYPYPFVEADALEYLEDAVAAAAGAPLARFAAVHASPPCQFATAYRRAGNVRESPNLIPRTRELLEATGLPYVIENVEQAAPELRDPVLICGSMYDPVMSIRRHRLFEANWPLEPPPWPCRHKLQREEWKTASNRSRPRHTIEIGAWDESLEDQRRAMGIDWMNVAELSQAVPPAYTATIGEQLMRVLLSAAA